MYLSKNVLIIEGFSYQLEGEVSRFWKSRLNAQIKYFWKEKSIKTLSIFAENKGSSPTDGMKNVIQDFMDGKVTVEHIVYDRGLEDPLHDRIFHVDIKLREPYKSLFEQLFDLPRWERNLKKEFDCLIKEKINHTKINLNL